MLIAASKKGGEKFGLCSGEVYFRLGGVDTEILFISRSRLASVPRTGTVLDVVVEYRGKTRSRISFFEFNVAGTGEKLERRCSN